jgi:glycosyltransferase involved in cell wall biosynthesis
MTAMYSAPRIGVVVIGRNEEERLGACLDSIPAGVTAVIYVDSGSVDASLKIAVERGADAVALDPARPYSAARARNSGVRRLLEIRPDTEWVQFIDGDCTLEPGWFERASPVLASDSRIAAVCGRRREIHPTASIYNRLCDLEWDTPIGEAEFCGGDVLMRCDALKTAGGFRESLIAGEEPELCLRLRSAGFRILRIDVEMTRHDAGMRRFHQWWTRAVRAGYAFAEVSRLHATSPLRIWRSDVRRACLWALCLPLLIAIAVSLDWRAIGLLGLYPLQAIRIFLHSRKRGWSGADAGLFSASCLVAKFAHLVGAFRFHRSRARGRPSTLIEYRDASSTPSDPSGVGRPAKIVELVNQYPQPSHTFVRREIHGLEAAGFEVLRVSVRETQEELADPEDRAEQGRTLALLGAGRPRLLLAGLRTALRRPLRTGAVALGCLRLASRSERGLLVHAAYLAEACLLLQWCRSEGADWIHAHFGTNATTVAMLCRRLGGPPFSFTVHGPEEFDQPRALALPEKMREAAFTVAISEYGRSQLMRWSDPTIWPRLHVVRCGIDAASIAGSVAPIPEENRLVCVARLSEQKGLFVLLDALDELSRGGERFKLRIVGDGPLRESIEDRLAELGLEESVELLGWQDGSTVNEELRNARGFVLPSFAEGLPVVLMEALGVGRPVVTTFVAGIPELVEDGRNGWLVPAGSARDLAGALRALLEASSTDLEEMGRRGVRRVAEQHDARASAERLGRLIHEALAAAAAQAHSTADVCDFAGMEHADV